MDAMHAAFDPEAFRAQGHRVVDQLTDYLARVQREPTVPVLPPSDPATMV